MEAAVRVAARPCTLLEAGTASTSYTPAWSNTSPTINSVAFRTVKRTSVGSAVPTALRSVRCQAKSDFEGVRYPNIPHLREWAEGDGSRRLAPWEEAELAVPGHYQLGVTDRDPVLENARQFRTLQQHSTLDGSNYTVISQIGQRADQEYYNKLPDRLRYGPQTYMAATDEYHELRANQLVEVEPIFKKEVQHRTTMTRWMGHPSGREKRMQRYKARRAEMETAKKGSA